MTMHAHQTGLAVIAVFKVVKGLLLLLVGLGLFQLVHADIATLFSLLIEALHYVAASSPALTSACLQPFLTWPH